ncbi:two-component sensor histidine kinase [Actinomycetales bacterium SN12]|nr:two-component sensor histidine kinase [Actinomycetales bacterium SN12]
MIRLRWTLRRKLVVSTAALVAAGLIATSVTTVLALRSFVYDRLDAQVLEGLDLALGPDGDIGGPQLPEGFDPNGDDGGPAHRVGSLQITLDDDGHVISSSYTATDGTEVELSGAQRAVIESLDLATRTPTSVDLRGELGPFRVAAQPEDEETVIAGASLADAAATLRALTVILVVVAGLTILIVAAALSIVVRRNLRPLDRVATVAQRVAGQPLSRGDVDIVDRVRSDDTDANTEVGRVGSSLNTLLGHIQDALAARQHSEDQLRRFIADASHELRTPLASIRGYAQLSLGEGGSMTPTQERSFDRIAAESERMSSLVDDLLLLARLDSGQTLRHDPVSLTLLVIDATSDAHAADDSHEWRLDVTEEQVEVVGDENRIRQVIANLLRNARVHTPPGTVVTTSLTTTDTHAVVEVADNGPGIDPSVQDRLFERFARGDHSRNRDAGSTGLGLSIAHAVITAHGGSLTVRSEPGETVFTVLLPL